jgi:hypothetical protein
VFLVKARWKQGKVLGYKGYSDEKWTKLPHNHSSSVPVTWHSSRRSTYTRRTSEHCWEISQRQNFRFSYNEHSVSYHPYPHFLSLCLFAYFSLCLSVCPSVLPPVLQASRPYNRLPDCYFKIPPSLLQMNNFESICLSLFKIQSVIDKYIYSHSYP